MDQRLHTIKFEAGKSQEIVGMEGRQNLVAKSIDERSKEQKKLGDLGGFGGGRGGGEENHISNSGGGGGHGTQHPPWRLAGIMGPARWVPPSWHGSYRLLSWLGKGGALEDLNLQFGM